MATWSQPDVACRLQFGASPQISLSTTTNYSDNHHCRNAPHLRPSLPVCLSGFHRLRKHRSTPSFQPSLQNGVGGRVSKRKVCGVRAERRELCVVHARAGGPTGVAGSSSASWERGRVSIFFFRFTKPSTTRFELEHWGSFRLAPLASTIHTLLPSSSQIVQSVYLQPPSSLLVGLKDTTFPPSENLPQGMDTLLVDHTTYDVDVAKSVAKQVGQWTGGRTGVVDAVFLEGKDAVSSGDLHFLVGGSERDFVAASRFLGYLGSKITHCGPSGVSYLLTRFRSSNRILIPLFDQGRIECSNRQQV